LFSNIFKKLGFNPHTASCFWLNILKGRNNWN